VYICLAGEPEKREYSRLSRYVIDHDNVHKGHPMMEAALQSFPAAIDPLELVGLTELIQRSSGSPAVKIGLIDGPVVLKHPDLEGALLNELPGPNSVGCALARSPACLHGTFVAGMLCAKRDSVAPAICPGCTVLIRPIFVETTSTREPMPSATPHDLASAIMACVNAGARVLNLSVGLVQTTSRGENALREALDHAVGRGVIVVAAAGNQATLGSNAITRHHGVIPVVACDSAGRPINESNLGNSIGRRGLCAPGRNITSLSSEGRSATLEGTSIAVPFVTGAVALLWSEFPAATATEIKLAILRVPLQRRSSVVPPVLNAAAAYRMLFEASTGRRIA
jgi:subtilisin family serine protease